MENLVLKMALSSFYSILPFSIIVFAAIIILILSTFIRKDRSFVYNIVAFAGLALPLLLLLVIPAKNALFNHLMGVMVIDEFSRLLSIVIILGTLITILLSLDSQELKESPMAEFLSILLLASSGMLLLVSAKDFVGILLGIEIVSLSSYVLTGFTKREMASSEASLKYFILGAFSSGILIYGMVLVFGATGVLDLAAIGRVLPKGNNTALFLCGMIFIITGFSFKIALVPFHMWAPDVYEGAPTPVAGYMAALVKLAAFSAFCKIILLSGSVTGSKWFEILWIISAITMTLGNLSALRQDNIKRMLAFSSISHAGYILVGVIGTKPLDDDGALSTVVFYLISYAIMTLSAFGCVIALINRKNKISNYGGIAKEHPILAAVLTIALLSLAGIPPFAGFFAKFYIFTEAIKRGLIFLVIIAIINSLIAAYYYLRVIVKMYFDEKEFEDNTQKFGFGLKISLALTSLAIVLIGIYPESILQITLFDKIIK